MIVRDILTPSRFEGDWYGWATNQISHIGVGLFLVFATCFIEWGIRGEFPYRWQVWGAVFFCYVVFEVWGQGWRGFDTIEDVMFVTVYGAGSVLTVFHEVNGATGEFCGKIADIAPFFWIAIAHLMAGSLIRIGKSPSKG